MGRINKGSSFAWKTKEVDGKRLMICQNSNLEKSKWDEFAPNGEECTEWTEVGKDTTASLCCRCTSRSVNF